MEIYLSNIITIKHPCQELLDWCKAKLIFKNPEYTKKVQMGFYLGRTPKYIHLFSYDKALDILELPSGCLDYVTVFTKYFQSTIIDYRVTPKCNISSKITLRNYQEPSQLVFNNHDNALISFFCGGGKTEVALALAAKLGLKTLFITHTQDLVKQAYDRCGNRLVCSRSFIKDGKVDLSGDMVFATVQTLSARLDMVPQDTFGLIIVDECHRTAVNTTTIGMFRACIEHFASKYKLGLSGTLSRSDGLACCIPYIIGSVVYDVREDNNEFVGFLDNKEVVRFPKDMFQVPAEVNIINTNYKLYDEKTNTYKDVFDKNGMTISFTKLISDLSMDVDRNNQIIDLIKSLKGSTIILSDRVDQLKLLQQHIPNSVQIDGTTKKKDREQALLDVANGNKKVLLASYKLAKEGLDCPILENIVLATPVKDQAIVIQSIGRVQRPYPGKTKANVYDLVDDVSMLTRFLQKRRSVYKKKGWWKNNA